MSTALGISAVSAVLENLLNSVYTGAGLGSVTVSALAPDIIQTGFNAGRNAPLQVNLFLYQVTPNAAWRNVDLPALGPDGTSRLTNQPLALDLHYLLTVYAAADCEAEALLGLAIQFIHEHPVLARADLQSLLGSAAPVLPTNQGLSTLLSAAGLASQLEMVKLAPSTLGREEMAWIWNAIRADYRPTFPFQASVVLIQTEKPLVSGPPVLLRQIGAQPNLLPPVPTLTSVDPPKAQPAACAGDLVTVSGFNLAGATAVRLSNSRLGIQQTVSPSANPGNTSFQFTIPNPSPPNPPLPNPQPADLPVGVYLVSAQVSGSAGAVTTSGLPLAIAPALIAASLPATLASGTSVKLAVSCAPYVRAGQQVALLIGGQEAPADPFNAPTNSASFTFAVLAPTGQPVPVRLRVDGIDSPCVDMTAKPPAFVGPMIQVT